MKTIKRNKSKKETLPKISKADLHVHSSFSDAKATPEEIVDWVHTNTDLTMIAITDHDEIDGAFEARKIANEKGYDLEVVIGEEVTAVEGHVVGLFLKKKIEPGMSAKDTIEAIHKQGGIAVAAHPFFQTRLRTLRGEQVDGVGGVTLIKENFDAVEIVNATPFVTAIKEGQRAKYLNRKLLLKAEVGGSDAHTKEAVGVAFTIFEGKTAADLKKCLKAGSTHAYRGRMSASGLAKYLIFCVPHVGKIGYTIMRRGFSPREPDIIKVPKDFR